MDAVRAVISGQQDLNSDQAKMDLSMENGKLKIQKFILTGDDIETESIQGSPDLAGRPRDRTPAGIQRQFESASDPGRNRMP